MTEHPAKDFTDEAIAIFEQIAINNNRGHPQAILDELERDGLIAYHTTCLTSMPPQWRKDAYVPLHIHYQWCQWASEQNFLDEEEAQQAD